MAETGQEKRNRIFYFLSLIATIQQMTDLGVAGGCIYDALIARAAQKSNVDRLLTFNANDFMRVWPKVEGIIFAP